MVTTVYATACHVVQWICKKFVNIIDFFPPENILV
jgi:hypothetical protein